MRQTKEAELEQLGLHHVREGWAIELFVKNRSVFTVRHLQIAVVNLELERAERLAVDFISRITRRPIGAPTLE